MGLLTGLLFAAAYLVNPIVGAYPLILFAILAWRGQPQVAFTIFVVFALAPIGWNIRNQWSDLGDHTSLVRAEQNFVQGSWPLYHLALNAQFSHPDAKQLVDQISEEERRFIASPADGLAAMKSRMSSDPAAYAAWYLFEKPLLLWDWSLRIGASDISFLQAVHDPFDSIGSLRSIKIFYRLLNPILFGLAIVSVLIALLALMTRRYAVPFGLCLAVSFFVYVTLVHAVLQAEPRYAIAYRAFFVVLAMSAVGSMARLYERFLRKGRG